MVLSNVTFKRLFAAIALPAAVRASLRKLDPGLPDLRWFREEQMHLTLSFFGEVETARQEALSGSLRQVRVPPFWLPLKGVGAFEAKGKPTVVWVGIGNGHPHLFALHRRIQDAVIQAGVAPDLRPFRPHVTVARAKGMSRDALRPFLKRWHELDLGFFPVDGFLLCSSVIAPEGATHEAELTVVF